MEWQVSAILALHSWMEAEENGQTGRVVLEIATHHYMPDLLTIWRLRQTCVVMRQVWSHRLPSWFARRIEWVRLPGPQNRPADWQDDDD